MKKKYKPEVINIPAQPPDIAQMLRTIADAGFTDHEIAKMLGSHQPVILRHRHGRHPNVGLNFAWKVIHLHNQVIKNFYVQ